MLVKSWHENSHYHTWHKVTATFHVAHKHIQVNHVQDEHIRDELHCQSLHYQTTLRLVNWSRDTTKHSYDQQQHSSNTDCVSCENVQVYHPDERDDKTHTSIVTNRVPQGSHSVQIWSLTEIHIQYSVLTRSIHDVYQTRGPRLHTNQRWTIEINRRPTVCLYFNMFSHFCWYIPCDPYFISALA